MDTTTSTNGPSRERLSIFQMHRKNYEEDRQQRAKLVLLLGQRLIELDIMAMTDDDDMRHYALRCADVFVVLWKKTEDWQQERYERFQVSLRSRS
ncbi:MAG: hypothetical protein LQ352_006250 [Teloschistes flavicans]|nr:MAG: hypothetical protein LQ352_006250 [Teloschistes flavicans]